MCVCLCASVWRACVRDVNIAKSTFVFWNLLYLCGWWLNVSMITGELFCRVSRQSIFVRWFFALRRNEESQSNEFSHRRKHLHCICLCCRWIRFIRCPDACESNKNWMYEFSVDAVMLDPRFAFYSTDANHDCSAKNDNNILSENDRKTAIQNGKNNEQKSGIDFNENKVKRVKATSTQHLRARRIL